MLTINQIKSSDSINDSAKQWAIDNIDYINSSNKLLGSSLKVEKGEKEGFYTSILYLQPADKVAIKTLCAGAKLGGCLNDCLIASGQLGMTTGQRAATRRTIIFLLDSDRFYSMLTKEIGGLYRKHGDQLAIRLNGTSDIDFSDFIATMPHVRFYDYTKIYRRLIHNRLDNYDLTYSGSAFSPKSIEITGRAVREGHRVAIAFNTAERKGEFAMPNDLLDFDETDLRFLDGKGLGGLKCKGGSVAKRIDTMGKPNFFFTPKTYDQLNNIIARG
jgi:hypothetical protein